MTAEIVDSPESKKEAWLKELSEFIVEANLETFATGKGEVEPTRPGRIRHVYERGDWKLDDEYRAYFKAPGETAVSYKGVEVWVMAYGGTGMTTDNEHFTSDTFQFLKRALMQVTSEMPYRGPEVYKEKDWEYNLELVGRIDEFTWGEQISVGKNIVFEQMGIGGTAVDRDENGEPLYPWDL